MDEMFTPAADDCGEYSEAQPALVFDPKHGGYDDEWSRMTLAHLVAVLKALSPEQFAAVRAEFWPILETANVALEREKASADRAEQVLSQLKRTSPATAVLEEMLERNWCFGDLLTAMDADVTDRVALELLLLVGPTESNMRLGIMAEKLDRAFDVSPGFFANIEKEWLDSSEPKPLSPVVELAEARKLAESETKNA